jgi:hypothetical protein
MFGIVFLGSKQIRTQIMRLEIFSTLEKENPELTIVQVTKLTL